MEVKLCIGIFLCLTFNPMDARVSDCLASANGTCFNCDNCYNSTIGIPDKLGDCLKCYQSQCLFLSAGFMTATLIFSVGCLVSKCNNTKRGERRMGRRGRSNNEQPLVAEGNIYVNNTSASASDGSCDSDQKSYAYVDIDRKAMSVETLETSVKSNKEFSRMSYDLVDRNRVNSSTVVDNDIPNPYSHVDADLEITEYDTTYYVKKKSEAKDPTYSHLGELKVGGSIPSGKSVELRSPSRENKLTPTDDKQNSMVNEAKTIVKNDTAVDEEGFIGAAVGGVENETCEKSAPKEEEENETDSKDTFSDDIKFKRPRRGFEMVQLNPRFDNDRCDSKMFVVSDEDSSCQTGSSSTGNTDGSSNSDVTSFSHERFENSSLTSESEDGAYPKTDNQPDFNQSTSTAVNIMYMDYLLPKDFIDGDDSTIPEPVNPVEIPDELEKVPGELEEEPGELEEVPDKNSTIPNLDDVPSLPFTTKL